MLEKLAGMEQRYTELCERLNDPAAYADHAELTRLQREHRRLQPLMETYRAYSAAVQAQNEAQKLLADPEMASLAREELSAAREAQTTLWKQLQILLLPTDPDDDRSAVLEIRAGVGGEEGALFAADLLRMYRMYAQKRGFAFDVVYANETELGGIKEAAVTVEGDGVWSRLKFEAGTHCVKRVPQTESAGRIHTSTATVAVMPEVEEVEYVISPDDLKIDTYRSSGAGGQHVNKTESAIRITHIPTGVVVASQQERSQVQNREKCMRMLASKLYEIEQERVSSEVTGMRRSQVGTGMRNERIRTYNFPQGRVTDHRINLTLYKLDKIMNGDIQEIIDIIKYVVYAIAIAVVFIIINMSCSKFFHNEVKQLGVLKASGFTSTSIRTQFALRFAIIFTLGAFLGGILSGIILTPVFGILFSTFGSTHMTIDFYPSLYLIPLVFVMVISYVAAYVASGRIKKVDVNVLITE